MNVAYMRGDFCLSMILHVSPGRQAINCQRTTHNAELENIVREREIWYPTKIGYDSRNSRRCLSALSSLVCWASSITAVCGSKLTFDFTMPFSYAQPTSSSTLCQCHEESEKRQQQAQKMLLNTHTHGWEKKSVVVDDAENVKSRVRENCNVWPTKDIQIGSWTWSDILQWWKMYECFSNDFFLLCFSLFRAPRAQLSRINEQMIALCKLRITHSRQTQRLTRQSLLAIFKFFFRAFNHCKRAWFVWRTNSECSHASKSRWINL